MARSLGDVVEATSDFEALKAQAEANARVLEQYAARFPDRAEELGEQAKFLRWLTDGNFVFLGYREYAVQGEGEGETIGVAPGSGLGILRDPASSAYGSPVPVREMDPGLRGRLMSGPVLTVAKSNAEATVHRRVRMDYVGVKTLDEQGRVRGERRFLGLFTSQAYDSGTGDVPILRGKLARVLERSGARPGGHDYKEIVTLLDTMPKEELFQASVEQLGEEVQAALDSLFTEEVRVVVRADGARGEAAVMVILPRGRYSVDARDAIGARLAQRRGRRGGGPAHGHGRRPGPHPLLPFPAGRRAGAPRARAGARGHGARAHLAGPPARRPARAGGRDGGRRGWRTRTAPRSAPSTGRPTRPWPPCTTCCTWRCWSARAAAWACKLRQPLPGESAPAGCSVLKLYLRGERLVLSDFMPILEDARMRVVEVDTFALRGAGERGFIIYSFAVQTREGTPIPDDLAPLLAESLLAVRAGDAVEDPFNGLTLAAGLRWREADLLRAYSEYAFQVGAIPSRIAVSRALAAYPAVTRLLIELFHARFGGQGGDQAEVRGRLMAEIEKVTALPDDRALRRLLALIEGTVRTNYYRHGGAEPTARSGGVPYISFKVRCADVDELRKTRLLYEVFVHSSRMEGVHLRGASVARGGIRWSDRPDDFRTEILGLVTTQMIKNAVIVPNGSKGGFITRKRFDDREQMGAEAAEQYRTLMRGLLDITDNIVGTRLVPPPGVVRHDGDDPYLVVAADKGTAHLSDVANGVAAEYGFWLGDAFA